MVAFFTQKTIDSFLFSFIIITQNRPLELESSDDRSFIIKVFTFGLIRNSAYSF